MWDIHRAQRLLHATLGINDRVNETLGITVELEITSQAADFINRSWRSWHVVEALCIGANALGFVG
jgi:hypothetical protein